MKAMKERELKFEVPEDFRIPPLPGRGLPLRKFVSTYFDTPDHALARLGITMRRRVENGRSLWQLKLPSAPEYRTEIEQASGPSPPSELTGLLSGVLKGHNLDPVGRMRTERSGRSVAEVLSLPNPWPPLD